MKNFIAGFATAFIFLYFEFATVAWLAGYEHQYNLSTLQIGFDPIWYNAGHTHIKDNIFEAYIEA